MFFSFYTFLGNVFPSKRVVSCYLFISYSLTFIAEEGFYIKCCYKHTSRPGTKCLNGKKVLEFLRRMFVRHFKHADYESGC